MMFMAAAGGYFYWDNAHGHADVIAQDFLAAMNI
jgi:hypothetical protein